MKAYGVRLESSIYQSGRAYLSLSGTWKEDLDTPMIFKREEDAATEAFNLIAEWPEYFGLLSVVELIPTVSKWIDGWTLAR